MRYSYYYQPDGSITDVLNFFALVELWQQEPIVRKLYRDTPNEDTVPRNSWKLPVYLYYEAGTATAVKGGAKMYRSGGANLYHSIYIWSVRRWLAVRWS